MKSKTLLIALAALTFAITAHAQTELKKIYNEEINPLEQIDHAIAKAKDEGKYVVCQVGGNWCPWCLRLIDHIAADSLISKTIDDNYIYIHVNYNPRKKSDNISSRQAGVLMKRLGQPSRFGFPVLVVLNAEGNVIHTQDSSFLEEGNGYDSKKIMRFLKNWTPASINHQNL